MLKILIVAAALAFAIPAMSAQYQVSAEKSQGKGGNAKLPIVLPQTDTSRQDTQRRTDQSPRWHKFVAWPEGITAWAILLTLIAIAWQSCETRKSAKAAMKSVRVMERQADLMEETAKRQLRAYLVVSHAIATITPQGEIGAQVNIENSGDTPAYKVRSWSHAIIAPYPAAGILKPPPPGLSQGVSIIPSKREQYLPAKPFPVASNAEKILETLEHPNVSYFVHGRVEYVDIFKDAHFLTFRLIIGGPATHGFVKDKDGNYIAKLAMDTEGNETDWASTSKGEQKAN